MCADRGGDLQAGIDPTENRGRFEEAHDLIIKCWTTPGPFRHEGKYYQYRAINPWVLPMQSPTRTSGSRDRQPRERGLGSHPWPPYMNLGALVDTTEWLRQVYIDTAKDVGFQPGPQHFGYLLRCLVADTDEEAIERGQEFMWTIGHRQRGPREHNDPPGYQSREAVRVKAQRPTGNVEGAGGLGVGMTYEQLQSVNNIIVGNPETVTRKLTQVIERLRPGYCTSTGMRGP